MKTFQELLSERVINSFDSNSHEKFMKEHGDHVKSMISKAYEYAGGYSGIKSGSKEEHDAIHADLIHPNHIIKATKRDGKINTIRIYKNSHGRKSIAVATDGTDKAKEDYKKIASDDRDQTHRNAWGEVSGKAEHIARKTGNKIVPNKYAEQLTGKKIISHNPDGEHYTRKIGDHEHEKVIVGNPKI